MTEINPEGPESALAGAIAARRWRTSHLGVSVRRLGQGSNNTSYLVTGANERVVIKLSRPQREEGALDEYRKEFWCAGRARELEVLTPEVLDLGVHDGRTFEVLSFVDGRRPSATEGIPTWQALGDYARRINSIPVAGWGGTLEADGRFAESWPSHVAYNISALEPDDELIERGILTKVSSRRLRDELERIARGNFTFGLCHGDIALWNTVIDGNGSPWLLDWGCAVASVVPHYEINEILRTARPEEPQLAAFLRGYGISSTEMAAMTRELRVLAALREVDTLRWAIEKKPGAVASLGERAQSAVANLD